MPRKRGARGADLVRARRNAYSEDMARMDSSLGHTPSSLTHDDLPATRNSSNLDASHHDLEGPGQSSGRLRCSATCKEQGQRADPGNNANGETSPNRNRQMHMHRDARHWVSVHLSPWSKLSHGPDEWGHSGPNDPTSTQWSSCWAVLGQLGCDVWLQCTTT